MLHNVSDKLIVTPNDFFRLGQYLRFAREDAENIKRRKSSLDHAAWSLVQQWWFYSDKEDVEKRKVSQSF